MTQVLKKELKEQTHHGNQVFPMAAYFWKGRTVPERVSLHWHPEIEIIRLVEGKFKLQINLQEMLICGRSIIIIPANMLHGLLLTNECTEEALVFNGSCVVLSDYDEVQSEILDGLASGNMPLPPIISASDDGFEELDALLNDCLHLVANTHPSARLTVKAKVLEMLAICYEKGYLSRKAPKTKHLKSHQAKLKDFLTYVNEHYAGPISAEDAAKFLEITPQHFCRYFKKATGMTFSEYLLDLRLRRAATEIIVSGENASISEIAFNHGFENHSYFYRTFKKKYGCTPSAYRERQEAPDELSHERH